MLHFQLTQSDFCYHNHIVFNSVSMEDGKKYHSNSRSYYEDVRKASDALCLKYGLSVIEPKNGKGKSYAQWMAEQKEIIDRIPFRYEYYLKKEIHCHNNRSVEMEIYERILRELKNFPEIPRLILLHSMLIGLRISEVCTLKGDAYSWQGRDAWIQVYQMKMRTYKRVPIPDVLYKIMKRYLEKYHIGSEDYVFQNKRGGAYQYGSFKWQMKELFNKRQDIFKGYDFKSHDFRHTIATLLYEDEVPLQSIRD